MDKKSIFDTPVFQLLGKAADLVLFNLLFLLCCIPVVTLGAAATALYDVVRRIQQDEGALWRQYWRAFRSNFRQATALWLLLLAVGALLLLGLEVYGTMGSLLGTLLGYVTVLFLALWVMAAVWVFPLQSRFVNPVKQTLRNAGICALAYLPRTLAMAALYGFPLVLFLYFPTLFLRTGPVWLLIWFALAADCSLRLLKKPFETLISKIEP